MPDFRSKVLNYLRYLYNVLPISEHIKGKLKEKFYAWSFDQKLKSRHQAKKAVTPSLIIDKKNIVAATVGEFLSSKVEPAIITDLPRLYDGTNALESPRIDVFLNYFAYTSKEDLREQNRRMLGKFEHSLLEENEEPFFIPGYCSICDCSRQFSVDYLYAYEQDKAGRLLPNWRESLVCEKCKMNNRVRAAADLVGNQIVINAKDIIYTTEQLTPFFQWLNDGYSNVIGSEYLGDNSVSGRMYDKIRHEDITDLSFDDNSLDCILSFDVLEHVPDVQNSLSEFIRCLKPGGFALISAPFASNEVKTIVRARILKDGSIEHILEPEYHGNPTKPDEGSLCFYHFGWDLLDQLRGAGASDAVVLSYYSIDRANIGNEQLFFLAIK